ncbi:MAG: hypothetical protein R2715_01280 [Ilumatobacteraceae bacterium]
MDAYDAFVLDAVVRLDEVEERHDVGRPEISSASTMKALSET